MMEPPPTLRISGIACFIPRNTPVAFTPITWFHASSSVCSTVARLCSVDIPALFTTTSSRPNRSTVARIAPTHSSSLATSRRTNIASPPCPTISSSVCLPVSSAMSAITTFAPSRANSRHVPRPIPEEPPVTSATLPSSRRPATEPPAAAFIEASLFISQPTPDNRRRPPAEVPVGPAQPVSRRAESYTTHPSSQTNEPHAVRHFS